MKKTLLLLAACLVYSSTSAQTTRPDFFGLHVSAQKKKARIAQQQTTQQPHILADTRATKAPINEYTEIDGSRLYRYVYAYNDKKERSSETIYLREREDGDWGAESICAVGNYSYEYDTQGRVKVKAVTYNDNNEGFTTYRIMVDYATDGSATYTCYEFAEYVGDYIETDHWTYRADGTLASHTQVDDGYYDGGITTKYDSYGQVVAYKGHTHTGELNDRYFSYDDGMGEKQTDHYVYDSKTGRLLTYEIYLDGDLERKHTYEYDEYGRIVSSCLYSTESEMVDVPEQMLPEEKSSSTRATEGDVSLVLEYKQTYTYANSEVYPINNSWRAVLNVEGPLTAITMYEYNTYDGSEDLNGDGVIDELDQANNCEYIATLTFERDANGKLLAMKESNNETADVTNASQYTVDANGHLVQIRYESEEKWGEGSSYYELEIQDFEWVNDKMVKLSGSDYTKYVEGSHSDESKDSYTQTYTYTPNGYVCKYINSYMSDGDCDYTEVEQNGQRLIIKNWSQSDNASDDGFNFDDDAYLIHEVQTEDVWFFRPNLKNDRDGFAPEAPVILSQAGRVVCTAHDTYAGDENYFPCEWNNNVYYLNIKVKEEEYSAKDDLLGIYYSISHDGENTIASNVKGLPKYVLNGNRLLKEYKYYNMASSVGGGARAVEIPQGNIYDEISYLYDDNGLLVGQQIVSVDEKGTRTEEVSVEYKYDLTGITETIMHGKAGLQLNGRHIGGNAGTTFCVYTTEGRLVAQNVQQYTFAHSGTYIVRCGNDSMKLYVK